MKLDKKMDSETAYFKAKHSGWSSELEEIACKEVYWAYFFARNIKEANIEKCQEAACKEASLAYCFALNIKGANIEKIRKLRPEISDKLDELVMERV